MNEPKNEPGKKISKARSEQRDLMGAALRRTPSDPEAAESKPRPVAPRVDPVRTTIDLAPDLHHRLKVWSANESVKLSEVFRALVDRLLEDPVLADEVRRLIRESKAR